LLCFFALTPTRVLSVFTLAQSSTSAPGSLGSALDVT
jgi:hypothetical protein